MHWSKYETGERGEHNFFSVFYHLFDVKHNLHVLLFSGVVSLMDKSPKVYSPKDFTI